MAICLIFRQNLSHPKHL